MCTIVFLFPLPIDVCFFDVLKLSFATTFMFRFLFSFDLILMCVVVDQL